MKTVDVKAGRGSIMRPCGTVIIDYSRCDACRECVELCPVSVFKVEDGKVVAEGVCILCLGCLAVCPRKAISIEIGECPADLEVEVK